MGFRQGKRETKTFAGNGGKNIRESTSTLVACEATPKAREVPCRVETRGAAQGLQGPQGPHGAHQRAGPECAQLAQPPEAPPSASTTCASRGVRPSLPSPPARPRCGHGGRGGGAGGCSRRRPLPDGRSGTEGSPPRTAPDPPRFLPAASFPRGNGTFLSGQGRRDVEKIIIDKYTHPEIRDSLSLGERQRAFWWDTPPPSPSPARPPHPCVLLPAVRCPAPPPPMPVSRVERGGPSPPRASPPCYPDVRTHRRWLWSL